MLPRTRLALISALLGIIVHPFPGEAANPKLPHTRRGMLEKYELKVPRLALDMAAVERLERGYPVKKQIQAAGRAGGRGIVVQDVHAPASVVMGRILDFDNYNKMVPNVAQCGNYAKRKLMHGDVELRTRYVLSIVGFKLEYFVRHLYRPSIRTLTWTLDYDRQSDLEDTAGYWSVVPLDKEGNAGDWSRVFYSVDLRIPAWVPQLVVNILNTQALTTATAWVKTQSERAYQTTPTSGKRRRPDARASGRTGSSSLADEIAKSAAESRSNVYGGGDLWEEFVQEFSDIIDTAKYASQVKERMQKREERAKSARRKKGETEAGAGPDDSRNILRVLWMTILFYSITQLWITKAERRVVKGSGIGK